MDERRRRFESLALPHLDAAYNLARWLSRSAHDADDIVQEAMLRAFRGFDGFRGADARPWLLQIVRNCWRDHMGRARKDVPLGESGFAETITSDEPDPEAQALRASEAKDLESVIATIPEEFREVLVLREIEDLSYREIAAVTEAPIGTVMSRLARARALLRERFLARGGAK